MENVHNQTSTVRLRCGAIGTLALLASIAAFGCAKTKEQPKVEPATAPSGTSPSAQGAHVDAGHAVAAPVEPILTIPDKLRFEAKNRPDGGAHAEDVFAAFEKGGVKVTEAKQHVGSLFGAKYCVGASADEDVKFSVCEYDSAEAAKTKGAESEKLLASVPNREVIAAKTLTLTVRQPAVKTAKSEATAKKAKAAFSAL